MRTNLFRAALLVALGALGTAGAVEPTNMQQASPVPLAPDGEALATRVVRLDPSLDHLLPQRSKVTVIKGDNYFGVIEGAAWVPDGKSGYLLFTDFTANVVYKWSPEAKVLSVFLEKSGFTGNFDDYMGHVLPTQYGAPIYIYDFGANGIALDAQKRLYLCAHGDRQVTRLEPDGTRTVIATGYQGVRFFHPNEMAIRSDGSIYITDVRRDRVDSPDKNAPSGVFVIKDRTVSLAVTGQSHGIAFSPDEKFLYVSSYGSQAIKRYALQPDGSLSAGQVFVDMTGQKGAPNGMAVDREGNVYSGGPGGLWIMDNSGKHIGSIPLPAIPAGLAFGGPDLKTLYILDARNLLQLRVNVPGLPLPGRLAGATH
jgi:sugar lactone lactonase YvrE